MDHHRHLPFKEPEDSGAGGVVNLGDRLDLQEMIA